MSIMLNGNPNFFVAAAAVDVDDYILERAQFLTTMNRVNRVY